MNEFVLPKLRIGMFEPEYPIIQGGMGVMVSGPSLAGAVAAAGGIGTIASVGLASSLPDFSAKEFFTKNIVLLKRFIAEAKARSKAGLVAVNAMCALTDYDDHIRAACDGGADIIISGAGLPLRLPELTEGHKEVALVPIVSSVKAANIIVSRWKKHYDRTPDAFVIETPNSAGGHLGARDETEAMNGDLSLKKVVPELVRYLDEENIDIPNILKMYRKNNN
ncbi:MAG: nitronate monooxygenase, partial [Synergistaceae bacterium]|nr:nitronate monooxygenase [Synergistaceae bacterium]